MNWMAVYRYGEGRIGDMTQVLRRWDTEVATAAAYVSRISLIRAGDPLALMKHTILKVVDQALMETMNDDEGHAPGTYLLEITRTEYLQTDSTLFRAVLTPVETMSPMGVTKPAPLAIDKNTPTPFPEGDPR